MQFMTMRLRLRGVAADNPNLNPPVSALLFQAFDLVDPVVGFRVWLWLSIILYVASVVMALSAQRDLRHGWPLVGAVAWASALSGFWSR
jgi:hypothetical protein